MVHRREPQTVRQVHEALSARRDLAYTTIMTVLQRLAKKNLVVQHRDDRAHRYAPTHGRDELVAGLMVDALDQAADSGGRRGRAGALRRTRRRRRGGGAAPCARRVGSQTAPTNDPHPAGGPGTRLRETDSVSALAFTLVALLPGRTRPGTAGARDVADACAARRDRAVAVHRAGRGAVGVQRGYRDREPAVRARSRRPADGNDHQRDRACSAGRCGPPTSRLRAHRCDRRAG